MNLRYEKDGIGESRLRDGFRDLLLDICLYIPEDSALGRLHDDSLRYHEVGRRDIPAKEVKADIDAILTKELLSVVKHRPGLERFAAYVARQVEIEKAAKIADRLVTQAIKAGLSYTAAQSLFIDALDRKSGSFPL